MDIVDRDSNLENLLAETGKIMWKCRGVSMKPLVRQGRDLIVIERPGMPLEKYDIALYRKDKPRDGSKREYVLHRVIDVEDDRYIILGDNCVNLEYVPKEAVVGKMTARVRGGKEQRLEGFPYTLYMNLWIKPWRFRVAVLKGRNKAHRFASKTLPRPAKDKMKRVLHKA